MEEVRRRQNMWFMIAWSFEPERPLLIKYDLALCFIYWRFGLTPVLLQKSLPVAYFMDTESSSTFCALLIPLNRNRCGMRTFRGGELSTDKRNVMYWLCVPVDSCTKFRCCISWDVVCILPQSNGLRCHWYFVSGMLCESVAKGHATWAASYLFSFPYLSPAVCVLYWLQRSEKSLPLQGASFLLCLLEHKVIILWWYCSHNTTVLSSVYNLSTSTTCFGQCCIGHHQVGYNLSEKLYRYDITQNSY
jgi:hypothetical protein